MSDNRSSARIQARLWIKVAGVDTVSELRRGDISNTGVFFETDKDIGAPGYVHTMTIEPFNRRSSVTVMTRVVRVLTVSDLWSGAGIAGVAMEFMTDAPERQQAIEDLLLDVTGANDVEAVPKEGSGGIAVEEMSTKGMVLETNWAVATGETIHLEVQAPATGRRMRIMGVVAKVAPSVTNGSGYRVEVQFKAPESELITPATEVEGVSLEDAISVLLEETKLRDGHQHNIDGEHLRGSLGHIQLPALLSFISMERMSGVLHISRPPIETNISVREGDVISVKANTPGTPRELLSTFVTWVDGEFSFSTREVDEVDQFGVSTTALLMQVAQAQDEGDII